MAQVHQDETQPSISHDEIKAALTQANGLDKTLEAHPTPSFGAMPELEHNRVIGLVRAGALSIIAFQFAYLAWNLSIWRILPDRLMVCHVGNILVGFVALGLTFLNRSWPARHWRAMALWMYGAVIAGLARISQITGVSEPLFVVCILLIVASGSTIPWEPWWQAAFNLVPLIGLLVSVPRTYDGFSGFEWAELATALVFSQITNLTFTRFREAFQRYLAELRTSDDRLRREMRQHEHTARDLARSETVLRTIFDAAVDLVTIVQVLRRLGDRRQSGRRAIRTHSRDGGGIDRARARRLA